MNIKFLEIFVKNQLMFNPNYDGEVITIDGERCDTSKLAQKYRDYILTSDGDGSLELLVCFLLENDVMALKKKDGGNISWRDIIEPFKVNLPLKYKAEDFYEKMHEDVYELVKSLSISTKSAEMGAYSSTLALDNIEPCLVDNALKNILGLGDTRFVYPRTKGRFNGNFLDIVDDDFIKAGKVKQNFTCLSNMIRCMGFPYSNYREFISYGILVSIGLDDKVSIIKDKLMYCCSIDKFMQLIEQPSRFTEWSSVFSSVYVLDDLVEDKKIQLEIIR